MRSCSGLSGLSASLMIDTAWGVWGCGDEMPFLDAPSNYSFHRPPAFSSSALKLCFNELGDEILEKTT